jgi:o-succinylbenzoate---CoA ligase
MSGNTIKCPLLLQAEIRPQTIGFECGEKQISFLELHLAVASQVLRLSDQGVRPGQVIATLAHNSLDLIVLAAACWRMGSIWAPLNPRWQRSVLEAQLNRLQPDWLWTDTYPEFADRFRLLAEINGLPESGLLSTHNLMQVQGIPAGSAIDADSPMDLIQTSGSSGQPKYVVHGLKNHLASAKGSRSLIPLSPDHAWLLSLPLYHVAGVGIAFRCLVAGARLVLPAPGETWLQAVRKNQVSHASLVNAQLYDLLRLLTQPESGISENHRLTTLLLGGSAISPTLIQQADSRGLQCFSSYGMTEFSSQIYTVRHQGGRTSGQLLADTQLKFDQRGQILIKGDALALGYWGNDRVMSFTDEEGWFATGDLGEWDDQCLKITGRINNMFVCGGENLQPETIEAILCQSPWVRQALVVPVPDQRWGQVPVAFIDWLDGEEEQRLQNWSNRQINGMSQPRQLLRWEEVCYKNNKIDRLTCSNIAQQRLTG